MLDWQAYNDRATREAQQWMASLADVFGADYSLVTDGEGLWFARATINGVGTTVQAGTPMQAAQGLLEVYRAEVA